VAEWRSGRVAKWQSGAGAQRRSERPKSRCGARMARSSRYRSRSRWGIRKQQRREDTAQKGGATQSRVCSFVLRPLGRRGAWASRVQGTRSLARRERGACDASHRIAPRNDRPPRGRENRKRTRREDTAQKGGATELQAVARTGCSLASSSARAAPSSSYCSGVLYRWAESRTMRWLSGPMRQIGTTMRWFSKRASCRASS
jgi:hypothetical protein